MISRSLILLVLLLLAAPIFAQIPVSSQALPGTPGYLVTHFPQIFQAVNAAADGDTIEVAPGTYSGSMDLGTKNLRIYSVGGSSVTTINCAFATRGFLIGGGQTGATQISGFRILNGRGLPSGGGLLIENGSSPLLRDLVFDHCRGRDGAPAGGAAGGYGGGVHVRGM